MPFFEKPKEEIYNIDSFRHVPVAVISYTSASGDITPMRFKIQMPDESIETVNIDGIKSHKNIPLGISYCCIVTAYGHQKQIILNYYVRDHRWVMIT